MTLNADAYSITTTIVDDVSGGGSGFTSNMPPFTSVASAQAYNGDFQSAAVAGGAVAAGQAEWTFTVDPSAQ